MKQELRDLQTRFGASDWRRSRLALLNEQQSS